LNYPLAAVAIGVGLLGIALAYLFYKKPGDLPDKVSNAFGALYKWAYHKFYIDELYLFITKEIIFKRISAPFAWFDRNIVDGTMNLIGNSTVASSKGIRKLQSGRLQDYAFGFIAGAVILAMLFIYHWII
jgi:NADH-quinone oxidoreductase subunit L